MVKSLVSLLVVSILSVGMIMVSGCETDAQNTALLGTAVGAGVGALAGGDTEGALIGAAIGGGAGYVVGNESDKKKQQQQMDNYRAQQNQVVIWITNSNGSQSPVTLRKDGPGYIGPRGERYNSLPTEEQLKVLYGY